MSERNFAIQLSLKKDFLIETHLRVEQLKDESYNEPTESILNWQSKPEETTVNYGGIWDNQFTEDELKEFVKTFVDLLKSKQIPIKPHMHNLLYFSMFFNEQYEQLELERNAKNALKELGKLFIDLLNLKLTEIRPEDERIFHVSSENINDLPSHLRGQLTDEQLANGFDFQITDAILSKLSSTERDQMAHDLYKAHRISLGDRKRMYLPNDLQISITGSSVTQNFEGSPISALTIPKQYTSLILNLIVKFVVDEHERHDTKLHQIIKDGVITADDMRLIYGVRQQVRQKSNNEALVRVCSLIRDYLKKMRLITDWDQQAEFIFQYMALLSAIPLTPKAKSKGLKLPIRPKNAVEYYEKDVGQSKDYIKEIFKTSKRLKRGIKKSRAYK